MIHPARLSVLTAPLVPLFLLCSIAGPAVAQKHFEEKMEDSLFALTNADRLEHGLEPLARSVQVSLVARSHSRDMAERNYFSHISPEGQSVWDRLARAGVWYASCAENVGKTLTAGNAHRGFMESEAHRANILGSDYTHLGVGILKGTDGYLYVTENFIEAIDTVDVDSTAAAIAAEMNRRRSNRRLSYLRRDPAIDSLAAAHSAKMLRAGKPGVGQDFGNIRANAKAFHFITPDIYEIFSERELILTSASRMGIGLVQGNSRDYGNGLLWITIIIIE